MKTKKLLSLLLALMMILSVVPMYASAADPIALTASNITTYPQVEGTIYYGQTVGEAITLTGGEVQYNGVTVPGEFVHTDSSFRPTGGGTIAARTSFTFNPEDNSSYTSIAVRNSRNVTYMVTPTTPILVDENDKPTVTTEVEAGTALSQITITGGKIQNPYYPEESRYISQTWNWVEANTVVEKSGYFDAIITGDGKNYTDYVCSIYVEVVGSIIVPEIEKTSVELDFTDNRLWSNVDLDFLKAIVKNEEGTKTEINGCFEVTDYWKNRGVNVGAYEIDAIFTPADTESYSTVEFKLPVTVNKGTIKFIDSDGTSTIPEITIPYGRKMGDDLNGYLKPYLNGTASFNYEETEYYNEYIPVGTHDLTVKTICDDPNYERENILPFKLTVEPVETAVTVKYDINKDNKNTYEIYVVKADVDGARPQGIFAIYVDGQLLKDGAKYSEHITWSPEKSKAYTVKVVYTPTANDPCLVADTEITVDAKLYRNITTVNTSSDGTKQFRCGEKIQVAANVPEFSGWVITDAAGNTVDLGVDLSAKSIELAVPDFDVKLEAKGKTSSGSDGLGNIFDMDFGDLSEGDSEWAIINIIRNLIAKFKSFLQQLIETFQSIGG